MPWRFWSSGFLLGGLLQVGKGILGREEQLSSRAMLSVVMAPSPISALYKGKSFSGSCQGGVEGCKDHKPT